ncbi:MAG: hypothetical protein AB7N72_13400 [Thermoleophilia bacterium]
MPRSVATTPRATTTEAASACAGCIIVKSRDAARAAALADALERLVTAVESPSLERCRVECRPADDPDSRVEIDARLGGWLMIDTVLRSIESIVGATVSASVELGPLERGWRGGWSAPAGTARLHNVEGDLDV